MNLEEFPTEILEKIFKNLRGTEAAACRAVCRRWRLIVDSLPDKVWEDNCTREFFNPKTAKDAPIWSYLELYKSLVLWSRVKSYFPDPDTMEFAKPLTDYHVNFCNSVFDMREGSYTQYDENEKVITRVQSGVELLCVTIKSSGQNFFVDHLDYKDLISGRYYNYKLLGSEVYFVSAHFIGMMCVARLKVVDGKETIETEKIYLGKDLSISDWVVAFAPAGKNAVNILTNKLDIYCYREKRFEKCCSLAATLRLDTILSVIHKLWEFGFHWSHPGVYKSLSICLYILSNGYSAFVARIESKE